MFIAEALPNHHDIHLLRTCATVAGRPLMWVNFLLVDNVLIDTGNARCDRGALVDFLTATLGGRRPAVVNSHAHEDHCGNNALVARRFSAPIYAPWPRHDFSEVSLLYRFYWGRPAPFPSQPLTENRIVTDAGRTIRLLPTPGHTPCHHCCLVEEDRLLYTGDAVPLPSRKIYSMPEEDYLQCIDTLRNLSTRIDPRMTVVHAHQGVLDDARETIRVRIDNMEDVAATVRRAAERTGTRDARVVTRALYGRRGLYDWIIGPRMSLEYTVASILAGDQDRFMKRGAMK